MEGNMTISGPSGDILAVKDDSIERPIPTAWRQSFRDIVACFVASDYCLAAGVAGAKPVASDTAAHIKVNLQSYGASLVALPEETWDSSVCIWYDDHWEALVDLWTQEEGRSDLVLHTHVVDGAFGATISVHLVYVP